MKLQRSRRLQRCDRRRSGSALVLSLIAVTVVTLLAMSYLELSNAQAKRQGRAADRKQAFYVAEAGLSESFAGMWIGKSGEVGSMAEPARFGDGLFWVEVEDLGDGYHKLDATGMYGAGRATLGIVVLEGGESVASLGIFSEDGVNIGPGTRIDRWDSDQRRLRPAVGRERKLDRLRRARAGERRLERHHRGRGDGGRADGNPGIGHARRERRGFDRRRTDDHGLAGSARTQCHSPQRCGSGHPARRVHQPQQRHPVHDRPG